MNLLVPVSWLRDYLKTDIAFKTISEQLSLSGPSVERETKHGQDTILDIEVTTNRPDAFSVFGIARECNAILNSNKVKASLKEPAGINENLQPDQKEILKLEVKTDLKLCPRFTAIILDSVKIQESPAIIKNRLEACNIRPINNIVDISNYVMLELGNPMHMFDYDKIKGAKMNMRTSLKGESVKTLDGQNRKLPEGTIVIEDAERLIDLCGIMGGENSAVSSRTKRVIVFVQAYDPIKIRKTTQALAFRTDAAARFEKGIDLESIPAALARAVHLAKANAGAKIASELIDIRAAQIPVKQTIKLFQNKLNSYLGIDISLASAGQILSSLGFKVLEESDGLVATVPHWRISDINQEEDLIEEIARIYGYHKLPSSLPQGEIPNETETDLSKVIRLKTALKYLGITECMTYSIISEDFLSLTGIKKESAVEISNPLSSEWQYMRPTLLISLADVISKNQSTQSDIQIFEAAKTYIAAPATETEAKYPGLPLQDLYLSIALQNSDFYKIKGLVENISKILGRELEFKKTPALASIEPKSLFAQSSSSQIICNNLAVGTLGILSPEIAGHFEIAGQTAVAELNLTSLYRQPESIRSYHPIPKFPPIIEDLSAIFDREIPVAQIISQIKKAGRPLLATAEILDIYEDEKIGVDKKSVTLRLQYQLTGRTPTNEDVTPIRQKIIKAVESAFSAQIRN